MERYLDRSMSCSAATCRVNYWDLYSYNELYTFEFIEIYFTTEGIHIKRDVTVIKRVLFILIFIILFGMPAISTTIVYLIFNYIGWCANYLTWLTFVTSFTGMTCAHTYYAKHIDALYSKRSPFNK